MRFSLLSLMVAVSLIAVVLGMARLVPVPEIDPLFLSGLAMVAFCSVGSFLVIQWLNK